MNTDAIEDAPPAAKQRLRNVLRVILGTAGVAVGGLLLALLIIVTQTTFIARGGAARTRASTASLSTIRMSVKEYQLWHAVYPPTLATLQTAKYLEAGSLVDGWGVPFVYIPNTSGATPPVLLYSCGPDRTAGTPDDISVPWP